MFTCSSNRIVRFIEEEGEKDVSFARLGRNSSASRLDSIKMSPDCVWWRVIPPPISLWRMNADPVYDLHIWMNECLHLNANSWAAGRGRASLGHFSAFSLKSYKQPPLLPLVPVMLSFRRVCVPLLSVELLLSLGSSNWLIWEKLHLLQFWTKEHPPVQKNDTPVTPVTWSANTLHSNFWLKAGFNLV